MRDKNWAMKDRKIRKGQFLQLVAEKQPISHDVACALATDEFGITMETAAAYLRELYLTGKVTYDGATKTYSVPVDEPGAC